MPFVWPLSLRALPGIADVDWEVRGRAATTLIAAQGWGKRFGQVEGKDRRDRTTMLMYRESCQALCSIRCAFVVLDLLYFRRVGGWDADTKKNHELMTRGQSGLLSTCRQIVMRRIRISKSGHDASSAGQECCGVMVASCIVHTPWQSLTVIVCPSSDAIHSIEREGLETIMTVSRALNSNSVIPADTCCIRLRVCITWFHTALDPGRPKLPYCPRSSIL